MKSENFESRAECIRAVVRDLANELMYYGRKSDEELPVGEIEKAVQQKEISVDEMIQIFSDELRRFLDEGLDDE